ncbi:type VI secretion system Vgr family protein [Chitiniphilus eburneus]|uniref:Type VI secretion system tip protein VgrG n=1 Tax=Chitiniphilus eburneus TaxID=2571148 RepID=A0A4V5MPD7_9NEIS|nr:type VI secretion system tip protein TssI/VgrG [Chitiniphilus eburneus]TJZ68378.1 type VI secretion system tip protein VgrG [Chitiniphilus eburneus]
MFDALNASQLLQGLLEAQHNRLLALNFPKDDGPAATLIPNRLDAYEGLSRDFRYTVEVLSDDPGIPLKDVMGKMVTLELVRENGSTRYFNGYVFEFRYVRNEGGYACYDMVLLPWLAFLRLRHDNYLFHGKTLREQAEQIFGDYPAHADWESRVNGPDVAMTDAYQFDESDYNYLHRRWEVQGWHYWYEHAADGHRLILADDSTLAPPVEGGDGILRWSDEAHGLDRDGIDQLAQVRQIVSGKVATVSFDFKNPKPQQALDTTLNRQGEVPEIEVYEYAGGYGFKDPGDGETLARRRMEEIESTGKHFEGGGNHRDVTVARTFLLGGSYDPTVLGGDQQDREFLVTELRHTVENNYLMAGEHPALYRNRFSCQRKVVPWLPGRGFNSTTPRIYGLQTAIVVGPPGEEIHCDEYGRVRVQFHWDREGAYDEKSSAWVRVATSWSGPNFGSVSVPRIGSEVIVQFLDGNPDRPLITGMVPNAATMPPWDLPANKTQSGLLSRSSPGGAYENANAIRFEDKKGQEEVWLHAEKDQRIEVENDESHWVGHNRSKTVDNDETVQVKHDRTETVDNNETITVHNCRSERVDVNETISVGQNRTEDVGQNETITIGVNRTETVGANETVQIGSNRSVTVGGNKVETVAMAKAETIGLAKALTIGGAYQTSVGAAMNTTVALVQAEEVGLSKHVVVGKSFTINAGDEFTVKVGKSSFTMKSDGTIILNGHTFTLGTSDDQILKADGNITLKAKKILEN